MPAKILGVNVATLTMCESVRKIMDRLTHHQQTFVITANAEIIMLAQSDPEFRTIITQNADIVLPDGAGVVLAANHLGYHMPERVTGYDLVQNLLPEAAAHGFSIYFFGAAPGIASAAAECAKLKYPDLKIAGVHNGFFKPEEESAIIEDINASGAVMLFLALGVPKQEKFIAKYRAQLTPNLLIGVGGTFDVMAGNVKRAPEFWQKHHLEWLYRLIKQPQRIGRMMVLPQFVFKVLIAKLSGKN